MRKEREEQREEKWKKNSELLRLETKEMELQDELETLRDHTVQIEQLEAKARSECAEMRTELEKKASELRKHQNKEKELQNELKMFKEEWKRTENETLRNHTAQIEQLEANARLKNEMQESNKRRTNEKGEGN